MVVTSRNRHITSAAWKFFYVLTFFLIYFLSEYLLSYYIYGDQRHYTNFYYAVRGASITEVRALQYTNTGSAEPFYGYMIWFASSAGIEKTPLMAGFNGIFAVLVASTVRKLGGSIALATVIFTNYYFIVLITAAERLKFSYMAFCLAILVGGFLGRIIFFSTPLIHLQSVLTIASVGFASFAHRSEARNWGRLKGLLGLSALFVLALLFFLRFEERIFGKFQSYSSSAEGILEIFQICIAAAVSILVARKKMEAVLLFLPLIFSAAILGGSRVNMIGFMILLYIGLKDGKSFHPTLLALYIYFAYKSVEFIENILTTGAGFV